MPHANAAVEPLLFKSSVEPHAWSLVLQRQQSVEDVGVACTTARASGVTNACSFVEAGEGELFESAASRLVGALLPAPTEFVEPETPSGALGTIPGFSALEIASHIQSLSNCFKRTPSLNPTGSGSTRETCHCETAEIGAYLPESETGCLSDALSGLPF